MAHLQLTGPRVLPSSVVGWVYNHASKNYWRVANWYELDDLVQDGLMKAYECLDKYGEPGVDIDPPHFMALVKTAFHRHIAEILRHSRADQELVSKTGDLAGEMSEDDYLDMVAVPADAVQEFVAFIAHMPQALRRAVQLYLCRPEELRAKRRVLLDEGPETEAHALNRLAGFPLRHDFEEELRKYVLENRDVENEAELVSKLVHALELPASLRRLVVLGVQAAGRNLDTEAAAAIRDLAVA